MPTRMIHPDHLHTIAHHARTAYPNEACGLIVRNVDQTLCVLPCTNCAANPNEHYRLDPIEVLRARHRGQTVEAIYHTHCDRPDAFSEEDRSAASLHSDERQGPLWPGVRYLVLSVTQGRPENTAALYGYNKKTRRFGRVGMLSL